MSVPLLITKLYFPPARINLVPRPRLIERLKAGLRGPLTLISAPAGFDKTTLIANLEIHEALDLLISHLHPSVHLVILTRSDPPLPLARLRVRNQLVEIRAQHLRFTPEEIAAFLQGMGTNQTGVQ